MSLIYLVPVSSQLQIHIFNLLFNTSAWISKSYKVITINMSKRERLISLCVKLTPPLCPQSQQWHYYTTLMHILAPSLQAITDSSLFSHKLYPILQQALLSCLSNDMAFLSHLAIFTALTSIKVAMQPFTQTTQEPTNSSWLFFFPFLLTKNPYLSEPRSHLFFTPLVIWIMAFFPN